MSRRLAWSGVSCCFEYMASYFLSQNPESLQPLHWSQVTTESMKSGSISPVQSHSARSKFAYFPSGAVIASKAADESSAFWVNWTPIFLKSGCRISNVRLALERSVGVITSYDIFWPFATRIPSPPFL